MFPTARGRLFRRLLPLFFRAGSRIAANVTAADANLTSRNVWQIASAEILLFRIAEEKFLLLLAFSQSFSLNAEFRCLFLLMISAFPEKNVLPQPTTPAKYSSTSNSPQANFSRPDLRKRTESAFVPADVADAQKNPVLKNEHGIFLPYKRDKTIFYFF